MRQAGRDGKREREREKKTKEESGNVRKREGRWKVLNCRPSNDLAPLQA